MTHAATAALLRNAHLGPSGVPSADEPVRDRSVVAPGARSRRGCSTACGRASRSARCSATASSAAARPLDGRTWTASSRRCAAWRPLSPAPARSADGAGRNDRGQQRRRRPGAAPPLEGGAQRRASRSSAAAAALGTERHLAALDRRSGHARRHHRRPERRAHGRIGLSDGARQHRRARPARSRRSRRAMRRRRSSRWRARRGRGTSLTHRLLLLMSGPEREHAGLARRGRAPRADAEPMLNFWAFKLLGDGTQDPLHGRAARRRDRRGGRDAHAAARASSASRRSTSSTASRPPTRRAQPGMSLSEIEQRVLYHAKHKAGGFDPARDAAAAARTAGRSRRRRDDAVRRARAGARHPAAARRRARRRSRGPESARAHRRRARSISPSSKRASSGPRTR